MSTVLKLGLALSLSCCVLSGAPPLVEDVTKSPLEGPAWDLSHGPLRVSEDGHSLIHEDGAPFLYLSDTNWELFNRASRQEAEGLMEKRRSQGFTVLFAPVTGILDVLLHDKPLQVPNAYGDLPFKEQDVTQPIVTKGADPGDEEEYDYWDHVDYLINLAASKGMHVAVLPAWSDHYAMNLINAENGRIYGEFLGKRLGKHSNLIWVLGGDTKVPQTGGKQSHREIAAGIRKTDPGQHLMSFHPCGRISSSKWFNNDTWIDFHMFQSGHGARDLPNYKWTIEDYRRSPARPTIDGENRYEDHAVNWNPINGWFNHFDNRQAAYWSLFSGAFGHAYGNRGVWQMWKPGRRKYGELNYSWDEAMDLPGAWSMTHLRALMLSRPLLGRIPDQEMLDQPLEGAGHMRAIRGEGFAMIYSPSGKYFRVNLGQEHIDGTVLVGWWFNPRTGEATWIGEFHNEGAEVFTPPDSAPRRGNDWILVFDDKDRGYPPPGSEAWMD